WLAIATAAAMLAAALFATVGFRRGYAATLLVAALLIVPAGHFGASLTHGSDFLTEPFADREAALVADRAAAPSWYADGIAPILDRHCTACHGASRRKGGLALHDPESIARGGASGSVLVADGGGPGPLLRRVRLPLSDDDHMPPDGKPQLSTAQIETLARWMAAGAPFDGPAPDATTIVEAAPAESAVPARARREPPRRAIAALQASHAHVEVIDPAAGLLWIDFAAVPGMAVEEIVRLLTPLAPFTEELSLRGVLSADTVLVDCAPWDQLRRLDLSNGTTVTADAAAELDRIETLERLHVWGAELPSATLARLRERPALVLNEGAVDATAPVAVEPEFELGAAPAGVTGLAPVNSKCPVTGAPVDPAFAIVHDGRVIGFCCGNCPGRFWEDPGAFTVEVARRPD
ncbi:MAG: c-type cytochrome domain-containing protein, partial [Planctomycetota bacterium]